MNTNVLQWIQGGVTMDNIRFIIQPKKYTGETSIVSMRIPKDMLKDIDLAAKAAGRTRNEILQMSLEFALNHMSIENK